MILGFTNLKEMASSWIRKYNTLNNSFKKKFIYRLGSQVGFFSEFNSLVLAMLYCVQNDLQFILSSKAGNFAYKQGWTDYFKPFCKETNSNFHIKHNVRPFYASFPRRKHLINVYKILSNSYLLQDLWPKFHNAKFAENQFNIDKLHINGSFLTAAKKIIEEIWVFQPHIQDTINTTIRNLKLSDHYYSFHIRGGDKVTEARIYSIQSYIDALTTVVGSDKLKKCTIYVATDDFNNITNLKNAYPHLNIISLCRPSTRGHNQAEFNSQTNEKKFNLMMDLLTEIEILSKSTEFVGTSSSNIGMFMGMRRGNSVCHYVDSKKWQFWTV